MRSLKRYLTHAFISLSIGPLLALGLIGGWFGYHATIENAWRFESARAAEVAIGVGEMLNDLGNEVRAATRYQDYFGLSPERQRGILWELLSSQPMLRDIVLLDASGRERLRAGSVRVYALDSPESMPGSRDWAGESLIQRTLADGEMHLGEARIDPDSGEPLMFLAIPFPDYRTGRTKAILLADIRLRIIHDLLADHNYETGERIYVLDRTGHFLSHPNPSLVLSGKRAALKSAPEIQIGADGKWVVAAIQEIRYGGQVLQVTAERDALKAFGAAFRIWLIYGCILLLALAAGLGLAVLAKRMIIHPMERLTGTALAIGEGDLGRKAEGGDYEELCAMADAFNGMTSRLHDSLKELEVENRIRTAAEERLALAMDATTDGLWDWNPQTGEVYFSPRYYSMLGYEPGELPGSFETWKNLLHPDDRDPTAEAVGRHLESGEPFVLEFRLRTKDGGYKWVLGRGKVAAFDAAGRPLRMAGTHVDIAERKRAEEELLRWAHIFENSGWGAALTDAAGETLMLFNPAYAAMHGYAPEELMGRPYLEVYPPAAREAANARIKMIAEKGRRTFEAEHVRRNGTVFPVLADATPVFGEDGKLAYLVINVQDISDLKRAEEELYAAKEQAEAASKAKSAFLANMSHEIRTPLNGVMGMLQLVGETKLNAEQAECVDFALTSARRLTHLLNDILDISRIEAGKLSVTEEVFDPEASTRSVVDSFRAKAAECGVDLSLRVDGSVPGWIKADGGRMRQVLFNLVGNAVKFTRQGSVSLEVGRLAAPSPDGRMRLLFIVSDTGIGIDDALLPLLFEPFTQAEDSFTRTHQGAGLGLSIVKRLAGLMGGGVCIESEKGAGTRVYFVVPAKEAAEIPVPEPAVAKAPAVAGAARRSSLRVLVVEDEKINLFSALRMLQSLGYEALGASHGREALDLLETEPVDCILMDVQMPVMDGLETAARIRSHPPAAIPANIPIVAMTAYAMQGDRERFLASGMDGYLSKPVEIGDLDALLQKLSNPTPPPA